MLAARVELFVDGFQAAAVDVGIYLGGGNIGMAQHDLDGPEVGPVFEQVGGERVPEGMRADLFVDAGREDVFLNDLPEAEPGHWLCASGKKQELTAPLFEEQGAA